MAKEPIDFEWVQDQFAKARIRIAAGKALIHILKAWDEIKISDNDAETVFNLFPKLAKGHPIAVDNGDYTWVPVQPGFIKVGDNVRVMINAFDGELGRIHNGRSGIVTAIRSGDIIVKTNDDRPTMDGVHYSPYKLEKRID